VREREHVRTQHWIVFDQSSHLNKRQPLWRVSRRRLEFGCEPRRTLNPQSRLVLESRFALTSLGLLFGLALGGAASRGLSSLVYGVSPYDALTFAGAVVLIGGGAVLMTYAAAARARSVDPLAALKSE